MIEVVKTLQQVEYVNINPDMLRPDDAEYDLEVSPVELDDLLSSLPPNLEKYEISNAVFDDTVGLSFVFEQDEAPGSPHVVLYIEAGIIGATPTRVILVRELKGDGRQTWGILADVRFCLSLSLFRRPGRPQSDSVPLAGRARRGPPRLRHRARRRRRCLARAEHHSRRCRRARRARRLERVGLGRPRRPRPSRRRWRPPSLFAGPSSRLPSSPPSRPTPCRRPPSLSSFPSLLSPRPLPRPCLAFTSSRPRLATSLGAPLYPLPFPALCPSSQCSRTIVRPRERLARRRERLEREHERRSSSRIRFRFLALPASLLSLSSAHEALACSRKGYDTASFLSQLFHSSIRSPVLASSSAPCARARQLSGL